MAVRSSLLVSVLLSCLLATCHGVLFSTLPKTLIVDATHNAGVLKAGQDNITVTWSLNTSFAGADSSYKTVKVKLCYAPVSQKDRGWRKTVDLLTKDKTCQHKIAAKPYSASNTTVTYTVMRDVPTATYFVRVYAVDANGLEVAYGQNTDAKKTLNLFDVQAISGRHISLDIASVCFSAFSIVSLFGFFFLEKRKAKAASK